MLHQSVLLLVSSAALAESTKIPRGVAPEDASLYQPSSSNTFTCLTHPGITIPFSRVNDDYCDCPDGSDEPGTSACASLYPYSLAIRGFYCRNAGHTPAFLPLSRVSDGVCDYEICCDGSDEYGGVNGIKCPSRCKEIGKAAHKLKAERAAHRSKGVKAREELLRKADIARREITDNIATTRKKIEGQNVKIAELTRELKETEERARLRVVRNPKSGSKVSVVVELSKNKVQEYQDALSRVKEERDAAMRRLEETENILWAFKEEYNPNFNDEGVKRAVNKWEQYLAVDGSEKLVKNDAQERDLDSLVADHGIDWDELAVDESAADDIAVLFKFEEYLPPSVRQWIDSKLRDFRQMLVDNGMLAAPREPPAGEPKAVFEAKEALRSAESDNKASANHLKSLEEDLIKNYGSHDVFRPLKGQCVSREFGEYKYEYCFLDKAYQISLKDHGKTSLGGFSGIVHQDNSSENEAAGVFESGWEKAHEEPLNGVVLKHEHGHRCWNGPERSVSVQLYCCAENEIRKVAELEKCVYGFEVGTPAVCEELKEEREGVKDEL